MSDDQKRPPKNPWASGFSAEREENKQFDVSDPQAESPEAQRARAARNKGIGAAGLGVGAVLLKFWGVLAGLKWLFIFGKFATFGGSFLISLWAYALFFGWRFALVFVFMILAHEMGHYVTIRNYGLPARLPMFIPLLGAYTVGGVPADVEHEAYIALAGPLTGLGVAALCWFFGYQTHETFWFVAAYLGAFLNLFNMIPFLPFDGGRIAGAFFQVPFGGRFRVGGWYLLTLAALAYLMLISHVAVPRPA